MINGVWRGLQGMALAAGLWAGAAPAEEAAFDVTLAGVPVAELVVAGQVTEGRYGVQLMIRSEGLAGIVRRIRFEARSAGRVTKGEPGLVPAIFREQADTGRRQSRVEMTYDGGVPTVVTYASPREDGPELLDPATQGGTLDPATAMFAGLRDRRAGQGCGAGFDIFDGRRRSAYSVSGDGVTCTGTYRRVAGYTPEEMAERDRFAIEVLYAPEGEVMRVTEASVQTVYGKVRLKRR